MGSRKKWPWQEWRLSQAQQHGLPVTKADLAFHPAECPICQRPALHICWASTPRGDQQATWWQGDYTGLLPSWRGSIIFIGIDTYSGYRFAFPAHDASAKLPSEDLQNALSTIMGFHKALLLIKGLTSEQMKWGNGPVFMKFTDLTVFPHHPKAAGMMERWNGLLKTQLQH